MLTTFDAVADGATTSPAGLLLAAGAGRRMGTPKALVDDWLTRGIDVLAAAGCSPVVVVLGAALQQARALLHGQAVIVAAAADWSAGLSASLRTGILTLPVDVPAAVVTLVDLPDVGERNGRLRPAASIRGPWLASSRTTRSSSTGPVTGLATPPARVCGRDGLAADPRRAPGAAAHRRVDRHRAVRAVESGRPRSTSPET
jgi:hypothetical protein